MKSIGPANRNLAAPRALVLIDAIQITRITTGITLDLRAAKE